MDVVDDESRVLELGSGMGLAAWLVGSRARRVHGVDISRAAVDFAQDHYRKKRVTFSEYDYLSNGPKDLLAQWPRPNKPPTVLAANPPYVPCESRATCAALPDGAWSSMYGGPFSRRAVMTARQVSQSSAILRMRVL